MVMGRMHGVSAVDDDGAILQCNGVRAVCMSMAMGSWSSEPSSLYGMNNVLYSVWSGCASK